MAQPLRTLVVARHQEDVSWLVDVAARWRPFLVQKDRDLPNEGREGSSFAHAIHTLYPQMRAADVVACVQGDPFPHCPDLHAQLDAPTPGFRWLGDTSYTTDGFGSPHHDGLRVAQLHNAWIGREWPGGVQHFAAGGQFAVTGRIIKRRRRGFYADLARWISDEVDGPWVMERLWGHLFNDQQRKGA